MIKNIFKYSIIFVGFLVGNSYSYGFKQEPVNHICYDIVEYSGGITVAYNCSDCLPYRNVKSYKPGSRSTCTKN